MATVHVEDIEEDEEAEEETIIPMLGSFSKKRVRADSIMPVSCAGCSSREVEWSVGWAMWWSSCLVF